MQLAGQYVSLYLSIKTISGTSVILKNVVQRLRSKAALSYDFANAVHSSVEFVAVALLTRDQSTQLSHSHSLYPSSRRIPYDHEPSLRSSLPARLAEAGCSCVPL